MPKIDFLNQVEVNKKKAPRETWVKVKIIR